MKTEEKKNIKDEIKEIKKMNIEELLLVSKYFIEAYFYIIRTFGINSDLSHDLKKYFTDFINCLKNEKLIHKYLLKNLYNIDYDRCLKFLDILDEVNEKTIKYYYELLNNIIDACELKNPGRAVDPNKDLMMLSNTSLYNLYAKGLTISLDNIKSFLNYPEDFWNFLESRIKTIDDNESDSKYFYSNLLRKDDFGFLTDFLVVVPKIVDLKTALINVHEFTHAYDLYRALNTVILENQAYYEENAKENEFKFCKTIASKKL